MKKAVFTNLLFKQILIGFIISLIVYNIIVSMIAKNIYGCIPVIIEFFLLFLIFIRNIYVKTAIVLWSVIFLIVGFGAAFLANLLDDINNSDFNAYRILKLVLNIIAFAIGVVIIDYSRRTIKLEIANQE
jgi:hypothetical protein